ncbi:hypothetical protein [Tichowtungia aerotolerans]|uniref:Autotransporter outer membrane beta-barrel domain-containing protein n=1 Tax=Tichowtungia aerotolerans TaxID=2697043 RepID=A0A6P1M552_9BACT|nr:hypothetical protein [Tichowtungia aerotolerans]QHI69182.1 hypothetical protein GT409_06860 [Tichowtungia aerotolerans]
MNKLKVGVCILIMGFGSGVWAYNPGNPTGGVVFTNDNAVWDYSTATEYIGISDSGNGVLIMNGGSVTAANLNLGQNAGASNNTGTVTGTGSTWSIGSNLTLGRYGDFNTVRVENGALMSIGARTYLGANAGSESNSLFVTGSGSVFSNGTHLYIGYNADGNGQSVTLSDHGLVSVGDGLFVGYGSDQNTLRVESGAEMTVASSAAIGQLTGSESNSLVVTGSGSTLSAVSHLYIGYGAGEGQSGTVSDSGNIILGDSLFLGNISGSNTLRVESGASVTVSNRAYIGQNASAAGNTLVVTGSGSVLSTVSHLYVGNSAASGQSVTISDGGQLTVGGTTYLSYSTGGNHTLEVTGSNSVFQSAGAVYVGGHQAAAQATGDTLIIGAGALLDAPRLTVYDGNTVVLQDGGRMEPGNIILQGRLELDGGSVIDGGFNAATNLAVVAMDIGSGFTPVQLLGTVLLTGANLELTFNEPVSGVQTIDLFDWTPGNIIGTFSITSNLGDGYVINTDDLYTTGEITVSPAEVGEVGYELTGSDVVVSWQGVNGLSYTLQRTTNLVAGSWSNVVEGLSGAGALWATNETTEPVAFYRITVE